MTPRVSVIIPTYNRAAMLRGAIDSVLSQQIDDLEVLVVDDGSTDRTRHVVEELSATDERVQYHHQSNAGASAARNAGIDLARGDYVAFLDSDDAWHPWHLRLQLAGLARRPDAGLIWANMDAVNAEGAVIASSALATLLSAYRYFSLDQLFASASPLSELDVALPIGYRDRKLYAGDVFSPMIMGNLVLPSAVVIRRSVLDRVGHFDDHFVTGEDYEFFLRACREGPVAYADVPTVRYRMGTADRLSGAAMALPMAKAYLQVLTTTLARDGNRITLPPAMVREARAEAHQWVGETELLSGSRAAAKRHLGLAFRIRPHPRTMAALAAALLPGFVLRYLITFLRRLRESRSKRDPSPVGSGSTPGRRD